MTRIYAIYDTAAAMTIGGLHLFRHDAAAIRLFTDIAEMKDSTLGKHPEDFDLRCLGELNEDSCEISPAFTAEIILTGKQWAAVHRPEPAETY